MHTYTEKDSEKENERRSKIERKQNIRGGQVSSGHLTSGWPNNLVSCQDPSGDLLYHSTTYFRKSTDDNHTGL